MKLNVWHFIMRYATAILDPSKNPHWKEVVAEISSCILKTHAEGGNPAKYWDWNEQEMKLASTFKKWACKGTVWFMRNSYSMCLEHQRQDIQMDGSHVEGSHKGWNSLQRVQKLDFVSSTHGSHHIHLGTSTSHPPLPELKDIPSGEHFGLVTSSFASTFGGLLDIKTKDSESPVELDMTGPRLLEALSGDSDRTSLATLDHFLKPRSRLPYCKALSCCPLPEPPGMSRSQHFFMIMTSIDACTMEISSSVEFHLFMDMRAEFAWISVKMTPKQWAVATESYNNCLEEKNHADGHKTVRKNPQALLRKLSNIKVVVMNRIAKNNFKCESGAILVH
ncbi:hypothetical protein BDR03DRAFT_936882 [Suillus americanus]|nr:hypothetical protein BDR03DRAFT_936882 [Suillus americanus]